MLTGRLYAHAIEMNGENHFDCFIIPLVVNLDVTSQKEPGEQSP